MQDSWPSQTAKILKFASMHDTKRFYDSLLSLNNSKILELITFIDLIYPCQLETKDTTKSRSSASCLDCYLYTENEKHVTHLYDKRDDFNFFIVNFPFLSDNIPSAPACGVYISQLVRHARACNKYQDFADRGKLLTSKFLSQGYRRTRCVNS